MKDYHGLFANICSPSTHRRAQVATLRPQHTGAKQRTQPPAGRPSKPFAYRRPTEPLTVTVRFLGGSEAWIRVESGPLCVALPGHVCLIDALTRLSGNG